MGTAITVLNKLGAGGFGTVYLAEVEQSNGLRQRVALKVLNVALSEVTELVQRQRDEARLLGLLNHPNIVQVRQLLEWNGRPAFTMEYVDGRSLSQWIRHSKQALPLVAALEVLTAVSDALQAAYTELGPSGRPLRVIHRDIKPANILLSSSGQIKLLDFGIARAHFDQEHSTRSAQMGTARYMSPEQWLQGEVSSASDVYALGISVIELLLGRFLGRFPLDRMSFEMAKANAIEALDSPEPVKLLLDSMISFLPADRPSAATVLDQSIELLDATKTQPNLINLHQLSRRIREDGLESLSEESSELTPVLLEPTLTEPPLSTPLLLQPIPLLHTPTPPTELSPLSKPGKLERWVWPVIALCATAIAVLFSVTSAPETVQPQAQLSSAQAIPSSRAIRAPSPAAADRENTVAEIDQKPRPQKLSKRKKTKTAVNQQELSQTPITISSIPMGALVKIDGAEVGRTLVMDHPVTNGSHSIELILGEERITEQITITPAGSRRFQWHVEQQKWRSFSD